jgi:hypothetical protein
MGLFDWFTALANGKEAARGSAAQREVTFETPPPAPQPAPADDADSSTVAGLDFKSAIDAHMQWKIRLSNVIEGTNSELLDVETVSRDDKCVLGKWINGPGSQMFGRLREFQELKIDHARFHLSAGDILACAIAGDKEGAHTRLHTGEYTKVSEHVKLRLARLYIHINSQDRK